jgi:hypothetical protein
MPRKEENKKQKAPEGETKESHTSHRGHATHASSAAHGLLHPHHLLQHLRGQEKDIRSPWSTGEIANRLHFLGKYRPGIRELLLHFKRPNHFTHSYR